MRRDKYCLLAVMLGACHGAGAASSAPVKAMASAPAAAASSSAEPRPAYRMSFSETARFERAFDDVARDAWQKPDSVLELLAVHPGQRIADVGAGTGYFEGPLARATGAGGHVLALDAEPNMVEHLARRARAAGWANVEAVLVPVDDPRLEPGSCDRILIVDTWHHIDHRARYAQKLRAALKPGGFVLIVDFTLDSEFGPPAKYRIPPAETQRELSAGRLDASVLDEDLPNQYAVRGVRR